MKIPKRTYCKFQEVLGNSLGRDSSSKTHSPAHVSGTLTNLFWPRKAVEYIKIAPVQF